MELNEVEQSQAMCKQSIRMKSTQRPSVVRGVSGAACGALEPATGERLSTVDLQRGFTLIEAVITLAIIGIVTSIAVVEISTVMPVVRANSARQQLMTQLIRAHQASIDQRRNYQVQFVSPAEAVTSRVNLDLSLTQIEDYVLPSNMIYYVFAGVPDTPDGFGNTHPVSFNGGADCGTLPCTITFQSDGSLLDSSGNVVNGTIFMGIINQTKTASAITIMGATGRMKGYSYASGGWH